MGTLGDVPHRVTQDRENPQCAHEDVRSRKTVRATSYEIQTFRRIQDSSVNRTGVLIFINTTYCRIGSELGVQCCDRVWTSGIKKKLHALMLNTKNTHC